MNLLSIVLVNAFQKNWLVALGMGKYHLFSFFRTAKIWDVETGQVK